MVSRAAKRSSRPILSREALLPILPLPEAFGCVPREAAPLVARALNLSRAKSMRVTFYHDFREAPPGRRVVKLCRAESCQAMRRGGGTLPARRPRPAACPTPGRDDAGRAVTVEGGLCLGLCASPPRLIDGEPLGRIDE